MYLRDMAGFSPQNIRVVGQGKRREDVLSQDVSRSFYDYLGND